MDKQPTALLGCGLLCFGVFSPIMQVPIMGSVNYLDLGRDGTPVGTITLGIAGVALLATFASAYRLLWGAGAATLALEAWAFWNVDSRMTALRETAANARVDDGGIASGIAQLVSESVRYQWGWPVIAAGGLALLIAAALDHDERIGNDQHGERQDVK